MKKHLIYLFLLIPVIGFGQLKSSIDFVNGLDYSYRVLNLKNAQTSFLDSRNIESGKFNYRFGLNFNLNFKQCLYLKTGIRLAKVGYQIKPEDFVVSFTSSGGFTNGGERFDISAKINHTFIEIPLILRYQFSQNRFSPFFEIGCSPNIYLNSDSRISIFGDNFNEKQKLEEANNLQMVASLSVGFNYTLDSHWQLFSQPIVRYHLTSLTEQDVTENLYNFSVEFGIRCSL